MNNSYFIKLDCCPVCNSKENTTLYSCNYLELPIREYLESFYGSKIDFNYTI